MEAPDLSKEIYTASEYKLEIKRIAVDLFTLYFVLIIIIILLLLLLSYAGILISGEYF